MLFRSTFQQLQINTLTIQNTVSQVALQSPVQQNVYIGTFNSIDMRIGRHADAYVRAGVYVAVGTCEDSHGRFLFIRNT